MKLASQTGRDSTCRDAQGVPDRPLVSIKGDHQAPELGVFVVQVLGHIDFVDGNSKKLRRRLESGTLSVDDNMKASTVDLAKISTVETKGEN